ncbi:MAG: hypothetical protein EAX96_03910 [Candidatus Lokiarchaeota archaeon]|nr:hypothetical protein [Candidatus Lokiarchaeota archaeon]
MIALESKFRGSLLGCSVGDALGEPFEGQFGINIQNVPDLTVFYRGVYTDDTQLTLAVAESLIRSKGFDPEDMGTRFVDWLDEPPIGPGMTCLTAVHKLKDGTSWKLSGINSGANGAVMRISPIGLFFCNDINKLIKVAKESSMITHTHIGAYSAAIVVARAIAYLTSEKEIIIEDFLNSLVESIKDEKIDDFKEHIISLKGFLSKKPQEALMKIGLLGVKPPFYNPRFEGKGFIYPYACSTALGALYAFLYYKEDFVKAVELAVKAGGDTDTVGAICGAISGTWNGFEKIPENLILNLRSNKKIISIADDLYATYMKK